MDLQAGDCLVLYASEVSIQKLQPLICGGTTGGRPVMANLQRISTHYACSYPMVQTYEDLLIQTDNQHFVFPYGYLVEFDHFLIK